MIKVLTLILTVLFLSVADQQDAFHWEPYYSAQNNEESYRSLGQQWPNVLPGNYFERAGFKKKPCPNRRSQSKNMPIDDQWTRTLHWKFIQPLPGPSKPPNNKPLEYNSNNLHYQSLKRTDLVVENKKDVNVNGQNSLNCLTAGHQYGELEQEQNQPEINNDAYLEMNNGDTFKLTPTTRSSKHDTIEHTVLSEKCSDQKSEENKQKLDQESLSPSRRFMSDTDDVTDSDKPKASSFNDEPKNGRDKVDKDLKNLFNTESQKPLEKPLPKTVYDDLEDEGATENKIRNINVVQHSNVDENLKTKTDSDNRQKSSSTTKGKVPIGERMSDAEDIESQLINPARGVGINELSASRMVLMESSRVCYACSSVSDMSCWSPTRKTMVKYCRKGRDACVTRTYTSTEYKLIVIRDCAESCDVSLPVLKTKYKSCSICKSNLCNSELVDRNSGYSINSNNAMFILFAALFIRHVI